PTAVSPDLPPAPVPAWTQTIPAAPPAKNPAVIFTGTNSWAEYRNNISQTLQPNPRYQWEMQERIERSDATYQGAPATHYRITQTSDYPEWVGNTLTNTRNGRIEVSDEYFDPATARYLGGTMTATVKGVAGPAEDIPVAQQPGREDRPSFWMGITPFGEMNITLTDKGTGPVTVPSGTYPNARVWSGAFRDGTPITFWVAPGIPVPVQYQFPNRYLDGTDPFQSYELKGWG
ncbi:MAG TPA: hypothetical protein VEI81_08325, partial [Methanoregula sp.]|nr:hypothetical protein [Methanoregula sp.]